MMNTENEHDPDYGYWIANLFSNFEALRKISKVIIVWIFRENDFRFTTNSKVRGDI